MSKDEKSKGKAAVDLVGSQIGKSGASWLTQVRVLPRLGEQSGGPRALPGISVLPSYNHMPSRCKLTAMTFSTTQTLAVVNFCLIASVQRGCADSRWRLCRVCCCARGPSRRLCRSWRPSSPPSSPAGCAPSTPSAAPSRSAPLSQAGSLVRVKASPDFSRSAGPHSSLWQGFAGNHTLVTYSGNRIVRGRHRPHVKVSAEGRGRGGGPGADGEKGGGEAGGGPRGGGAAHDGLHGRRWRRTQQPLGRLQVSLSSGQLPFVMVICARNMPPAFHVMHASCLVNIRVQTFPNG